MKAWLRTPAVVLAGALFVVYLAVGFFWVYETRGLTEPDALFHADTVRVIQNETSVSHVQGRTVLHPLHVAMTVPLGLPLAAATGSPELSAVVLTALFAVGCLLVFERLLQKSTRLPALDRALFVALLGFSAGHFTFASVPETHVISTFFLGLAALRLASDREPVTFAWGRAPEVSRAFSAAGLWPLLLASGALVTNVFLAPLAVALRLGPSAPRARVYLRALLLSGAMVVLLGVLHVAQRKLLYVSQAPATDTTAETAANLASASATASSPAGADHVAPATSAEPNDAARTAAAAAPEPAPATGSAAWFAQRFENEFDYVSWSPARLVELTLAIGIFNLYTPRVERYELPPWGAYVSPIDAVRIDYWKFDFRVPGAIGAVIWAALVVVLLGSALRAGLLRTLGENPVYRFVLGWIGLYFAIFNLYHVYPIAYASNDVFLFAPDLVFPFLFCVAVAYDRGSLVEAPKARMWIRSALAFALVALAVDTSLHVTSLLSLFARA